MVIGNGFDLHCNLETSYKNYFDLSMKMRYWLGQDDISDFEIPLKKCENSDFFHEVDEAFAINELMLLIISTLILIFYYILNSLILFMFK